MHGEADGLPSLIVDRYDRWLVIQLLSAGLEAFRTPIVDALRELLAPDGILARNDTAVRTKEGLTRATELLHGDVPREIEVTEHGIRYLAAPWDGQKTGAFLDQRENRVLAGSVARGRALDCFAYHGSFALHLARNATSVTALDSSGPALARARENAARNGLTNIQTVQTDAFEFLRAEEHAEAHYDTIVLDPPAFAKTRHSLDAAIRGYKEINLRAMRLLSPGRDALHRELQLSSLGLALSRHAPRRCRRQRAPHRAARVSRAAARSSRGAHDSGERLHQGRAPGGARLESHEKT